MIEIDLHSDEQELTHERRTNVNAHFRKQDMTFRSGEQGMTPDRQMTFNVYSVSKAMTNDHEMILILASVNDQ